MNSKALELFGKILMEEVRDRTIKSFERRSEGKLKAKCDQETTRLLKQFNEDQMKILRRVVVSTIDETLHNFLFMFEQHEEMELNYSGGAFFKKENLAEVSDGLCGELYTEDGWVERFSRHEKCYL